MGMFEVPRRRLVASAAGAVFGLASLAAVVFGVSVEPASNVVAQCTGNSEPDSYSMSCVPPMVPDFTDQLSEAEVAEPGFNAPHGGGGGGGGGHR